MQGKPKKTLFLCQQCGYESPKWLGKCPGCGEWNSFVEEQTSTSTHGKTRSRTSASAQPVLIHSVELSEAERSQTGIDEFDRVLGGGLVPGSLVLLGGDPGVGKSTLMLQVLCLLASRGSKVLYVSGEESIQQIRMRAERLHAAGDNLWVVSETNLFAIQDMADDLKPDVVVMDSIQTVFNPDVSSAPGSVSQVREATMHLMLMAKKTGASIFVVGHVTKDGAIAGPRLLEHMVDTVLYVEGSQNNLYRILRAVKNRFGSTNELGVFEMKDNGLQEIPNPSSVFLPDRYARIPGSVITARIEGSRPILLEIQGLVSQTALGTPRRTVLGVDYQRVSLLLAVMEKKMGIRIMGDDVFINVAGGVKVDEPAVDLAIVAVVASSCFDKPVNGQTVVVGEIGLTGEVRPVHRMEQRVHEAQKMGIKKCLLPQENVNHMESSEGIQLVGIHSVDQLPDLLF